MARVFAMATWQGSLLGASVAFFWGVQNLFFLDLEAALDV